jgi:hypothetical protein
MGMVSHFVARPSLGRISRFLADARTWKTPGGARRFAWTGVEQVKNDTSAPLVLHAELAKEVNAVLMEGADTVARLMDENARLQRVVDDLAGIARKAYWQRDYATGHRRQLSHDAENVLRTHGLLRACDDPAQVPEAMRGGE